MRRRHQPIHFKDLDWYKYVRRYFWDDETTPNLVPVERLHRRQADYEILAYVIFVSLLYGSVMLLTMSGRARLRRLVRGLAQRPDGGVRLPRLRRHRHFLAASASVLAPAGALVYSLSWDVHPDLGSWDRVLLIVFSLVWLGYSMRLMHIAKRYREMSPPPAQD